MRDDAAHRAAWPLVVRVAMVGSLLAAALGAALYRFAGVSPAPIVIATRPEAATRPRLQTPSRSAQRRQRRSGPDQAEH